MQQFFQYSKVENHSLRIWYSSSHTENQFSLLKAIAKDSIVAQPTSGKFIKEHKLSGASSVKAALKVLEDKELVYRTNEGYIIYDRFMDLWLKRI